MHLWCLWYFSVSVQAFIYLLHTHLILSFEKPGFKRKNPVTTLAPQYETAGWTEQHNVVDFRHNTLQKLKRILPHRNIDVLSKCSTKISHNIMHLWMKFWWTGETLSNVRLSKTIHFIFGERVGKNPQAWQGGLLNKIYKRLYNTITVRYIDSENNSWRCSLTALLWWINATLPDVFRELITWKLKQCDKTKLDKY